MEDSGKTILLVGLILIIGIGLFLFKGGFTPIINVANMTGPMGPMGPQGPIGPQGPQGEQGLQGEAGPPANAYINTTVLYLPFEENASTTTYDWSIYSNDGTISGASWVNGRYGKALSFDGVDDYVNVPYDVSIDNFNEFTITLWMYPTVFDTSYRTIINKGWNAVGSFFISMDPISYPAVKVGFWAIQGAGSIYTYYNLPDINQWYFLACQFKIGLPIKISINGGDFNSGDTCTETLSGVSDMRIADASNDFKGIIDEVRIYNRALSANEVLRLYSQGPFFLWGS